MDFLTLLKIIFIAIVEGITEWLPVSSTGHLILCEALFDMKTAFGPNGYAVWEFFLVFVQFAAILAVIVAFFKQPTTRTLPSSLLMTLSNLPSPE